MIITTRLINFCQQSKRKRAKHDRACGTMKHWSKRTGGQGARVARRTGLRASPCGWGQWSCTDALNSWLPRTHVESVVDDYFSPVVVTLWSREQQFSKSRVLHQPKRPRMSGPAQRTDTTMSCHTSAHARTTRPSRACRPYFIPFIHHFIPNGMNFSHVFS